MEVRPSYYLPLLFVLILNVILIGMGLGMIFSALTTKYRDLSILINFGLGLVMYLSAVMYSLEAAKDKLKDYFWLVEWNPLAHIIESYRTLWFNNLEIHWTGITLGFILGMILFFIGLVVFNNTEKTFIDTV